MRLAWVLSTMTLHRSQRIDTRFEMNMLLVQGRLWPKDCHIAGFQIRYQGCSKLLHALGCNWVPGFVSPKNARNERCSTWPSLQPHIAMSKAASIVGPWHRTSRLPRIHPMEAQILSKDFGRSWAPELVLLVLFVVVVVVVVFRFICSVRLGCPPSSEQWQVRVYGDPMGSDIKDVIVLLAAVPAKGSTQASGHQVSTYTYTFTQYYMY